ncbi:MAG: small-conductance mechanosensitive channel [Marivirga sp.]
MEKRCKERVLRIAVTYLIIVWIDKIDSIGTFLDLVSAGLAIALQVPTVNVAAWLFIVIRKPFIVGDRIEIGGVARDVIDIRFFQFTINEIGNWVESDQSTGRIIHVPNGEVFRVSQANYDQGFSHVWNELAVLITFESNWKLAKSL